MSKKFLVCIILIVLAAVYFRSAGLFRGMDKQSEYHPDVGKQVIALRNFLNDKYHWRAGNQFERGYPYALNHLDEMILRTVAASTAMPEEHRHQFFNNWWVLHQSVRVLRVLYGMLCLLLLYKVTAFMSAHHASRLMALFLFAVTPVAIDVSHFGTGDIGVDLFGCVVLVFLALYARTGRLAWLFLSSVSVGVAFACKYNGLLTGVVVILYFVMLMYSQRTVAKTLWGVVLIVAGFVCGVLAATPAFFIVGGQHLDDILASMKFIQQYGFPRELLELSLLKRLWIIFSTNVPRISMGFGWAVMLFALVGTVMAGYMVFRYLFGGEKSDSGNTSKERRILFSFAVFLYPFLALIASLTVKYAVMPFHFSYLAVPLILAAVFVIDRLVSANNAVLKILALACFALMSVELGKYTLQNNFFWQQVDNNYLYFSMAKKLENDKAKAVQKGQKEVLKGISLEPENSSFFRNRYHSVSLYGGSSWNEIGVAPVPSIPYPDETEWIFLNGPVLPLNDRMFQVSGGWNRNTKEKQLVLYEEPHKMSLGIRSGFSDMEVELEVGGAKEKVELGPWEQKIVEIVPARWKKVEGKELGHDIYFVPLRVSVPHHGVWVSVLSSDREKDLYRLFGGQEQRFKESYLPDISDGRLAELIGTVNYYSSRTGGFAETAGKNSTIVLTLDGVGLPAGAYTLSCRVKGSSAPTTLEFQFRDNHTKKPFGRKVKRVINKSARVIRVPLEKPYLPYGCEIIVTALQGSVLIDSWEIKPHARKIIKDLKAWQTTGKQPSWILVP